MDTSTVVATSSLSGMDLLYSALTFAGGSALAILAEKYVMPRLPDTPTWRVLAWAVLIIASVVVSVLRLGWGWLLLVFVGMAGLTVWGALKKLRDTRPRTIVHDNHEDQDTNWFTVITLVLALVLMIVVFWKQVRPTKNELHNVGPNQSESWLDCDKYVIIFREIEILESDISAPDSVEFEFTVFADDRTSRTYKTMTMLGIGKYELYVTMTQLAGGSAVLLMVDPLTGAERSPANWPKFRAFFRGLDEFGDGHHEMKNEAYGIEGIIRYEIKCLAR